MEGKSLDSWDGGLKQDKQEKKKKTLNRKIRRGFEIYTIYFFSQIANEDKDTEWQTSHPPLYVQLEIKNWKKCSNNVYNITIYILRKQQCIQNYYLHIEKTTMYTKLLFTYWENNNVYEIIIYILRKQQCI